MSDIIDAIAAALNGRGNYPLGSDLRPEAERVLAALRERYAIVELPEPDGTAWPIDFPRQRATGWVAITAEGVISFPRHDLAPTQARSLAAALLAAADKAEEGK
ncbi:MAG: hypothetical protein K0U84_01735 [Actinomycetia bacterium]|nr:hypothetical protein [Actinomycetes bacterium]